MGTLFQILEQRRRELGMSYAELAKRSRVSRATVFRILSGADRQARFPNVLAIADALGATIRLELKCDADAFRESRAEEKATRLVQMVQGTSGLEGQAVDEPTLQRMRNQTIHELLAGSNRKLWGE